MSGPTNYYSHHHQPSHYAAVAAAAGAAVDVAGDDGTVAGVVPVNADELNDAEFVLRGSDEEVVGDDDGELPCFHLITVSGQKGDVGDD